MTPELQSQLQILYFEGDKASSYWVRFSILLSIALIIATLGLYRNSGAVVIAAMLIAPLMTPILGIASAIVMGATKRLLQLLIDVTIASVGTSALAFVILFLADAPRGMVIPDEVMARTDPGLEELMVALVAGIAGAYVQIRKEEASALPGVAIGVSLVPPLSAAGMLLYFGEPGYAWEATLLYLTNLAAIVLSASAVFYVLGMRPEMRSKGYSARVGLGVTVSFVVVAILTIELFYVTIQRFEEARAEERVATAVQNWIGDHAVEIVSVDVKELNGKEKVELQLIFDVPAQFASKVASIGDMISKELQEEDLFDAIVQVLGRETEVVWRANIRYISHLDLSTDESKKLVPQRSEK